MPGAARQGIGSYSQFLARIPGGLLNQLGARNRRHSLQRLYGQLYAAFLAELYCLSGYALFYSVPDPLVDVAQIQRELDLSRDMFIPPGARLSCPTVPTVVPVFEASCSMVAMSNEPAQGDDYYYVGESDPEVDVTRARRSVLRAAARGYLLKDNPPEELISAIGPTENSR